MHAGPKFSPGDPVRDKQAHDEQGRVEIVRSDGAINVRWTSGRTEWIDANDIEWAPGFRPKKRRP